MRPAEHPHWHIDYLRPRTTIEDIWVCYDRKSREHDWARCFAGMPGASVPLARFGASDCDCESHLFFFEECPARQGFNRRVGATAVFYLIRKRKMRKASTITIPHPKT
jgi:Uri superfamily endonuclease